METVKGLSMNICFDEKSAKNHVAITGDFNMDFLSLDSEFEQIFYANNFIPLSQSQLMKNLDAEELLSIIYFKFNV